MRIQRTMAACALVAAVATGAPAHASGRTDTGWITNGLAVAAAGHAAPCTTDTARTVSEEWGVVGPVVCFPKPAGTTGWTIEPEDPGPCTYTYYLVVGVYGGDCLIAEDLGTYVKVWGAAGVLYRQFTIVWS